MDEEQQVYEMYRVRLPVNRYSERGVILGEVSYEWGSATVGEGWDPSAHSAACLAAFVPEELRLRPPSSSSGQARKPEPCSYFRTWRGIAGHRYESGMGKMVEI